MRSFSLILVLSAAIAHAEDIVPSVTINGKEYHNVRVQTVRQEDLILRHELGILKVKLEDLPEPFRSKYFTAERVRAAQMSKAKEAADQSRLEQAAKDAQSELQKEREFRLLNGNLVAASTLSAIVGVVREVRPDGVIVRLDLNQSHFAPTEEESPSGLVGRVLRKLEQERGDHVFVRCGPPLAGAAKVGQQMAFEGRREGWFEDSKGPKELRRLYLYEAATPYRSPLLEELRARKTH